MGKGEEAAMKHREQQQGRQTVLLRERHELGIYGSEAHGGVKSWGNK